MGGREGGVTASGCGYKISFGDDENALELGSGDGHTPF